MNISFAAVIVVSISAFIFGAVAIPDDLFITMLSFWSLAMSVQIIVITWRASWRAIIEREPNRIEIFALGLMLVNIAIISQRAFGFAVLDFNQNWLLHSDVFSGIIALMIAGQSLKYSAIEEDGGRAHCLAATASILRALVVGFSLAIIYWTLLSQSGR